MEKYFAIIYHNLKPISDTTPTMQIPKHCRPEIPYPKSSLQSRRHPPGEKSYCTSKATKTSDKRVSFRNGVNQFETINVELAST